jgi:hypothetical protein
MLQYNKPLTGLIEYTQRYLPDLCFAQTSMLIMSMLAMCMYICIVCVMFRHNI